MKSGFGAQWSVRFWQRLIEVAVLVMFAIWFAYVAFTALSYPLGLDVNENFVLNQVQQFLKQPTLATLYPSITQAPYEANPYPPLFQVVTSGLVSLLGVDAHNAVGRGISLLGLLIAAACLGFVVRQGTSSLRSAFVAALGYIFSGHVLGWAVLNRVDFLGLALTSLGVLTLIRFRRAGPWVGAAFFALAFFTKVSFVAAPVAALVYLWLSQRRKEAVAFTAAMALLVGGGVAVLNVATQGQFLFHIITINANQFYYLRDLSLVVNFFASWPVVFLQVPAFAYLYLLLRKKITLERGSIEHYLVIYVVVASLTLPSYARAGSGVNYFFEFQWVLTALALVAFVKLTTSVWRDSVAYVVRDRLLVVLFIILNLIVLKNVFSASVERAILVPYTRLDSDSAVMGKLFTLHGGEFFEEFMTYRPYVTGNWYLADARMFVQLAEHGVWNEQPFVDKLTHCEIKAVVLSGYALSHRRYEWTHGDATLTDNMIAALKDHYELGDAFGDRFIYYPRLETCLSG